MFLTSIRADSTQDRSVFGDWWFRPLSTMFGGAVRVTPATAMGLPTVYSCIKVIAESFASMTFDLYQPKASGGRTRNTKHWLYRLMRKRPNRFQSPFEWRLMLMGHLALRGNAFCQIEANGRGEITELLPLHPDRMFIEVLGDGSYRYKYIDQNGREIYYTPHEIWHLRGMSDDGYMGLSPIALAREAIGEGLAIQAYSNRFFANDARPGGGYIEYEGKFKDLEAKKTFRDHWQKLQGGANRGKVAVLEKGMKYHELGLKNVDAQFIEVRAEKKSEIAAIWRVPPHKVGDLSRATFANIEQQSIEFWTDTMLPWAELWESSMEFFLLGPDEPLELEPEFDMSRMMRGDSTARSNYYQKGILSGWLTRNEAREMEGLDPLPGLDEPLTPTNMLEPGEKPDDGSAPTGGKQRRSAMAEAQREAAAARTNRMQALLRTNAARLARRFAKGDALSADLVRDAMAVPQEHAHAWFAVNRQGASEEAIAASLLMLAGAFDGDLPPAPPVVNVTVAPHIEQPVTVDTHVDANRTTTKYATVKRHEDGTLETIVKEVPNAAA